MAGKTLLDLEPLDDTLLGNISIHSPGIGESSSRRTGSSRRKGWLLVSFDALRQNNSIYIYINLIFILGQLQFSLKWCGVDTVFACWETQSWIKIMVQTCTHIKVTTPHQWQFHISCMFFETKRSVWSITYVSFQSCVFGRSLKQSISTLHDVGKIL